MAALDEIGSAEFQGLADERDVSAIARLDSRLVVGADEGAQLSVLSQQGDGLVFAPANSIELTPGTASEIDIEGAAFGGDRLYVTGSHSLVRKRIKKNKTYEENLERLRRVEPQPHETNPRDVIFRLNFDRHSGQVNGPIERLEIRDLLRSDEVLGRFTQIPSKENGVDIEGIAIAGGLTYLGFRGPVLRSNFVPIMILDFDTPKDYALKFLDLGGLGVRDMNAVGDGFLVLAGPVGDGPGDYQLFLWDGEDCIPGEDREGQHSHSLGLVPAEAGAKAEGFTVLRERDDAFELLFVYDGLHSGGPRVFEAQKG